MPCPSLVQSVLKFQLRFPILLW